MNLATGEEKIKIGITLGDCNGVGPEIIIKTLSDNRVLETLTPVIYGSAKILLFYKKFLPNIEQFHFQHVNSGQEAVLRKVNLVNCWNEEVRLTPGESNETGAIYAVKSLERAVADVLEYKIHGIVTAPLDKSHLKAAGFDFPGHTEYLIEKGGGKGLMLMVHGDTRVALATGHLGIKDVPKALSVEGILDKLRVLNQSLMNDFSIRKPKIALLALNPHAGDGGLFGDEEKTILQPAIAKAVEMGIMAIGPFPADGLFASGNYEHYDAILAMYHDQGLIPFKTLSMIHGVNYTAGLKFIRTSPDHGPAFDLAGKGIAKEDAFREALFMAADIYKTRMNNRQYRSNPLKSLSRDIEAKEDETLEEEG